MRFSIEINQSAVSIFGTEGRLAGVELARAETLSLQDVELKDGQILAEVKASWGLTILDDTLPSPVIRSLGVAGAFRVRRGLVPVSFDGEHFVTREGARVLHVGAALIEGGVLLVGDRPWS